MRIAFLGDTALIGRYDATRNNIDSVTKRFRNLKSVLDTCDYIVANLEAPFTDLKKTREYKTLALRSPVANIEVLKTIGINVVSLANNHIFDYGRKGFADTIEVLKKSGIDYYGVQKKTLLLSKENSKVLLGAFCCYTTNGWHYDALSRSGELNTFTREEVEHHVELAHRNGAYPIVSLHWGEENTHYPRYDHLQFAEKLLGKNNMTIIGHHPHVMQGIKQGEQSMIAFSLGNFCFDDSVSDKSTLSIKQTQDNMNSIIIIADICEHTIEYEIIPIKDMGSELVIAEELLEDLKRYSDEIENIGNVEVYNQKRRQEILAGRTQRLGKRDIRWLVGHLNMNAIMAVLQRKINQYAYKKTSKKF